jgi:pyrroline-5-carboxylate reductase
VTDQPDAPALPSPIAVIGGGSLGFSILSGLVAAGAEGLRVTTRTEASGARYGGTGIEATSQEADAHANVAAVRGAKVVIVGVKPYAILDLLAQIRDALEPGAIVVSLAVGIPIPPMERVLRPGAIVLRAMPNTPVGIGMGMTGVAPGSAADAAAIAAVEAIFRTVGEVLVVEDRRIDPLSAMSGSGPAYVYQLIEHFVAATIGLGFSEDDATAVVEQTFRGALALLEQSGEPPAELRRKVTSPNGTTAAALAVFAERDLGGIVAAALDGAIARALELAPPTDS